MSAESASTSGYMGAFQDFVQAKSSDEPSVSGQRPANSEVQCQSSQDTGVVLEHNSQSSSGSAVKSSGSAVKSSGSAVKPSGSSAGKPRKRQKRDSDDDDDETESDDLANNDITASESEGCEPPAVPKRPRTQRSAKQKVLTKINSRRGRGRG